MKYFSDKCYSGMSNRSSRTYCPGDVVVEEKEQEEEKGGEFGGCCRSYLAGREEPQSNLQGHYKKSQVVLKCKYLFIYLKKN